MKKPEVSVLASAGGARFQYTLLKSWCPRRSAFSMTPLSVVMILTYLRAFRGGSGRIARGGTFARFEALLCLRRVSCHVAAADLEAAAVVLAVLVVQALAAYKRGVKGLVNRQAYCVFVWRALLRRVESHTQLARRGSIGVSGVRGRGHGERAEGAPPSSA